MKYQPSGAHWAIAVALLFWAEALIQAYNLAHILALFLGIAGPAISILIAWWMWREDEEFEET